MAKWKWLNLTIEGKRGDKCPLCTELDTKCWLTHGTTQCSGLGHKDCPAVLVKNRPEPEVERLQKYVLKVEKRLRLAEAHIDKLEGR